MRRPLRFAALPSMILLAVACAPGNQSGPPPNDTPASDQLEDKQYSGLKACRGSATDAQVDNNVEIALDFRESCHEMIVCGGLNASFATSIIGVLIDAASGKSSSPTGFTFDGKGTYSAKQMDVQFFLGADTSFGKAGDLITFDLLEVGTYFTGAKLTAKGSIDTSGKATSELSAEFTGLGPGVELLGLGASPKSPVKVDAGQLADALGKIRLASKIHIDDEQAHAHIKYELTTDPASLSAISSGQQTMHLVSIDGSRADTMQKLSLESFTIDYRDIGGGYLEGQIGFEVSGGKFPFQALFSYPRRSAPDVVLGCAGEKLTAPDAGQ